MKYIDADLLRAVMKEHTLFYAGQANLLDDTNALDGYDEVLAIINSLQHEQPEVDLEKEIEKTWLEYECYNEDYDKIAEMRWNEFENVARHFYELGKQAMKQQMLKDAVEGKVYFQMGDIKRVKSDDFENPDIHLDDKVKLIIVKEENK